MGLCKHAGLQVEHLDFIVFLNIRERLEYHQVELTRTFLRHTFTMFVIINYAITKRLYWALLL